MTKAVVCLLDTSREAESVVKALMDECGCKRADIGMMARGSQGEALGGAGTTGDRSSEKASAALKGSSGGAAVGALLGLLAGLAIPGVGPFVAAGPIASALAGAGVGAAAGGLVGVLNSMGLSEEEAHSYAEGVRRGGTLVTVHAQSEETARCAEEVMRKHGAADIEQRASQWKAQGWSGRFPA
jgi:hypothetical protein